MLFPTVSLPSHPVLLPVSLLPTSHSPQPTGAPQAISHGFPSVHPVVIPVSLLPTRALPKLLPTVSLPSTLSSLPSRSFSLSPSYFSRFPFRPPCRPSCIAPSHRSSPQAISHGFPSVHPVIIPVSLLPHKPFPTAHRSSPSYFPRFPFRPPCRHSRIAPSHPSSPQATSHGFPSVHPLVASVSLLPHGARPMLFPTVSTPSTQSSLPSVPSQRSSPQAISDGFPSVHPLVKSVSLPRGKRN